MRLRKVGVSLATGGGVLALAPKDQSSPRMEVNTEQAQAMLLEGAGRWCGLDHCGAGRKAH